MCNLQEWLKFRLMLFHMRCLIPIKALHGLALFFEVPVLDSSAGIVIIIISVNPKSQSM